METPFLTHNSSNYIMQVIICRRDVYKKRKLEGRRRIQSISVRQMYIYIYATGQQHITLARIHIYIYNVGRSRERTRSTHKSLLWAKQYFTVYVSTGPRRYSSRARKKTDDMHRARARAPEKQLCVRSSQSDFVRFIGRRCRGR